MGTWGLSDKTKRDNLAQVKLNGVVLNEKRIVISVKYVSRKTAIFNILQKSTVFSIGNSSMFCTQNVWASLGLDF